MSELNAELMSVLIKNESIDEVFHSHPEAAMNDLLKIELAQFCGYEKNCIRECVDILHFLRFFDKQSFIAAPFRTMKNAALNRAGKKYQQ